MAVAAAAVPGIAEGLGLTGGGTASGTTIASAVFRVQGDFKSLKTGLNEAAKQSKTKGKEAAGGIDQIAKSVDQIKKTTAFLAFSKGMEMVVGAINFLIDHSQVLQSVLGAVNDIFGGMIDIFLSAFLPAIMPIINAFASLIPVVAQVSQQFQPLAQEIGQQLIKFFHDNKDAIDKVITAIVELIGTGLITFMQVVVGLLPVLNPLIQMMGALFQEAAPVIKVVVEALAAIGATGIVAILGLILASINVLMAPLAAIKVIWDVLSGAIKTFIGWIKAAMDAVKNFADSAGKTLGGIGGGISNFFGGIGNFFGGLVPHFASGGLVTSPTFAMVGESGPEYVIPQSQMANLASSAKMNTNNAVNIQINVPNVHIGSPDPKTIRQFTDLVELEMRKRINMGLVSTLR